VSYLCGFVCLCIVAGAITGLVKVIRKNNRAKEAARGDRAGQ
jgi:hypothetical protein